MEKEEAIREIKRFMSILPNDMQEAIMALVPELAESEDERIRKAIIGIIKNSNIIDINVSEKQMLAYLEKQKDTDKAIEAVERIDKYIDEHVANAHDMKDSNPDKKYYRGWDDALAKMSGILQDVYSEKENKFAPRVLPCSAAWFEDGDEKQKEQKHYWKPTETDVALFNKAVTTNNTLTPAERANLDIIRSKFSCCHAINCSGIMQKEQKSKNELENAFKYYTDRGVTISCEDFEAEPKKEQKQEWSEEDEDNLNRVIRVLEDNDSDWKELSDWLKSLSPQPKPEWNEEDETILKIITSDVGRMMYKCGIGTDEWNLK